MPRRPATACAAKNTSGGTKPTLMKSAPAVYCSATVATATASVPALSGVRTVPGIASKAGESSRSGSVPAARCWSIFGEPDIWRKPVIPLASISSSVPAGSLSSRGWACMSR